MFANNLSANFVFLESPLVQFIAVLVILRGAVLLFRKKKAFIEAVEKLPGPSLSGSHPLLAHLKTILDSVGTVPGRPGEGRLVDIFENWLKESKEHGLCRIWAFDPYKVPFAISNIFVSDPQILRQLVADPKIAPKLIKDPRLYGLSEPLVGNSIFSLPDGPKWKHARKVSSVAFRQSLLEHANQIIANLLQEKVFSKWGQAKTFELQEWATRMAVESIGRVAFNFSFGGMDPQDPHEESLYETFEVLKTTICRRGRSAPGLQYLPTRENFTFSQKSKRLNSVIWSIIKERQGAKNNDEEHQDLLSYLMKEENNLDANEIFGNVRMFLLTGHDSTSTSLACALWELATHPAQQERLQEEIDALFDKVGGTPSYKDLMQLPYLDAVAKETLRMYAPGGIGRQTIEDVTVRGSNGNEYTIPAGCAVFYFPGIASRLDKNCDRPDEFDPDRFLQKQDGSERAAYHNAYAPFSVGSRSCIGQPLAMAQLKSILAHVVRHYSLSRNVNASDPIRILLLTIKLHEALIDVRRRR